MLEPLDIAIEVHKLCESVLIPKGISPDHTITIHGDTTAYYARSINQAGLDVTGKQVVDAIIKAAKWDMDSPWPGHPAASKVISILTSE